MINEITPDLRHRAVRVATRIVGDQAEDAVQNASLRLVITKYPFRGSSTFSTYFFAVVRNEAFGILRRGHAKRRDAEMTEGLDENALRKETGALDPERLVLGDEIKQQVLRAIYRLSEKRRVVILSCYFENPEMPQKEVAQKLGLTVSALKTRLHYALRELAEYL